MKKAIMAATIFVLLLATLSGCSSPKSDFTAALQKTAENRQYTTNVTFQVNNLSDSYIKKLGPEIDLNQLKNRISNIKFLLIVIPPLPTAHLLFTGKERNHLI